MDESEYTQVGIDKKVRDKVKVHVVLYQKKYETMADFINKAALQLIEDDEHDNNSNTIS